MKNTRKIRKVPLISPTDKYINVGMNSRAKINFNTLKKELPIDLIGSFWAIVL
jgi:hypothetical protein